MALSKKHYETFAARIQAQLNSSFDRERFLKACGF